jgi:hypothetical protein
METGGGKTECSRTPYQPAAYIERQGLVEYCDEPPNTACAGPPAVFHRVRHSALVLGPYGRQPDLAHFGIVLLIVEDIGIARVFSLIQTLVLRVNNTVSWYGSSSVSGKWRT